MDYNKYAYVIYLGLVPFPVEVDEKGMIIKGKMD